MEHCLDYGIFLCGRCENRLFGTALDEIQVIIHVKKRHSDGESTYDHTVHLTGRPRIGDDHSNQNHLNQCNLGHHKTFLDSFDEITGLRGGIFRLPGITGHF